MAEKFVIKNDLQHRNTLQHLRKFEEAVSGLRHQPLNGTHPRLRQAEVEALESRIEDFTKEIEEWEAQKALTNFIKPMVEHAEKSNFSKKTVRQLADEVLKDECTCRRGGMLVDGVHCERCKSLGLPPPW
ncbi:MAG: hypothetical protein V3V74_07695 [Nitrosomonadaceae bacterium]